MKLPFALARRFVAGETLDAALPAVDELRKNGLKVSLDLLGEDVSDRTEAEESTRIYIALLDQLASHGGTAEPNISIKLSMLGQRIDVDFCESNLRRLLDRAKELNAFVRLDMEGSDLTQNTLDIFERAYPDYRDNVGIVLQAYLHRTPADIERMIELQARVRLCKGAYKEPASIAIQKMPEIRKQYIELMQKLLLNARYPAIATHDDELIEATKIFVDSENILKEKFEFQMLYGIRSDTIKGLADEGYNARIYVPYGTQWFPYFTRRLRERKENVWFVLKNLFRG